MELTIKVASVYEDMIQDGQRVTDHGREDVIKEWTARYPDGIEVDLKLVNAYTEDGGPWSEAVWFEDGCELGNDGCGDSLLGEWCGYEDYKLIVELEEDDD